MILSGLAAAVIPAAMATFPASKNGPIVFLNCDNGDGQLYRINPDGTGRKRLTSDFPGAGRPRVSPEGNRIAFLSDPDSDPPQDPGDGGIYIVGIDGGTPVLVPGTLGQGGEVAWTPDGESLVFECNLGLCKIPVSGGVPAHITGTIAGDELPDVSPDGLDVAFLRYGGGEDDIYRVPLSGGVATQLAECLPPRDRCDAPSYAPDGIGMALQIGIFEIDGSTCIGAIDLTQSLPATPSCLPNSVPGVDDDEFPVFSPDGTLILFDAGDGNLATHTTIGSTRIDFSTGRPHSCGPSWGAFIDKNAPEAFCGQFFFEAQRKAEGKKRALGVTFISKGCSADALIALQPDLVKFDAALDAIATKANTDISNKGGAGKCDPDLVTEIADGTPLLIERVDLLDGAGTGEDFLISEVMELCDS